MGYSQVDNASLLAVQSIVRPLSQGFTAHSKGGKKTWGPSIRYALLLLLRVHYAWDQHPILLGIVKNVFPLFIDRAHPYNDANYLVNDNHNFLPHRSFLSHGISVMRHNIFHSPQAFRSFVLKYTYVKFHLDDSILCFIVGRTKSRALSAVSSSPIGPWRRVSFLSSLSIVFQLLSFFPNWLLELLILPPQLLIWSSCAHRHPKVRGNTVEIPKTPTTPRIL